jgi:hypothetical protein
MLITTPRDEDNASVRHSVVANADTCPESSALDLVHRILLSDNESSVRRGRSLAPHLQRPPAHSTHMFHVPAGSPVCPRCIQLIERQSNFRHPSSIQLHSRRSTEDPSNSQRSKTDQRSK